MSIYDSLLAQASQAYQTANQDAMARAQMPTFADKFLSGLRGGAELGMKQNMDMAQMQHLGYMNQNYKDQRLNQLIGQAGKFATPDNLSVYDQAIQNAGGLPGMVPEQGGSLYQANKTKQDIAKQHDDTVNKLNDASILLKQAQAANQTEKIKLYAPMVEALTQRAALLEGQAQLYQTDEQGNPLGGNTIMGRKAIAQTGMYDRSPVAPFNAATKGAPPGYEFAPDGSLRVIAGGPVDEKQQMAEAQDKSKAENIVAQMQRLKTTSQQLAQHPGLANNYGALGVLPNAPGSTAADYAAQMKSFVAQLFNQGVNEMKGASNQTGIGRILQSEVPFITQKITAIQEKAQSPEQARQALSTEIPTYIDAMVQRIQNGVQSRGMANIRGTVPNRTQTPVITSQSDYDALPVGASYTDSAGNPHIKGGAK